MNIATEIASKSPVAVQGSKLNLNYARDHTVEDSLNHIVRFKIIPPRKYALNILL